MAPETLNRAQELLCASLAPADERSLLLMLGKLSTLVARRAESEEDSAVQLGAYVERLRSYPADIAAVALDCWPEQSKFWPTWFELKEMMEPMVEAREALLQSLNRRALPKVDERQAMLAELEKADPQRAAMLKRFRVVS